jgi:NAD(P)-dependent dehydrogenase (short-subunit alcohol dehydrogenase family)
MKFDGKVLLATGAGSGLGEAVARRFTAGGGRVAVLDLDGQRAQAMAAELPGAIALECDVAEEGSVAAATARTREELGAIHCVAAAAGYADSGPIEQWSLERWNRLISVHLTGTFLICKHAVPLLREAGGGSIVTFSSIAARVAQGANGPYGAAKAGIIGLTIQLAGELAPEIRVNSIAPGRIRTPMTEPIYAERGDGDPEKGVQRTTGMIPMRRVGEAPEIAATVCHLLSDEVPFLTGQTIVQDGGETIV